MSQPPGHPIVSSVNSPTEKISQLLDMILKPLIINNTGGYTPDLSGKLQTLH